LKNELTTNKRNRESLEQNLGSEIEVLQKEIGRLKFENNHNTMKSTHAREVSDLNFEIQRLRDQLAANTSNSDEISRLQIRIQELEQQLIMKTTEITTLKTNYSL